MVSYVIFAIANKAEEHNPWAIIIVREASHPHVDPDINPVIISPICPTDE